MWVTRFTHTKYRIDQIFWRILKRRKKRQPFIEWSTPEDKKVHFCHFEMSIFVSIFFWRWNVHKIWTPANTMHLGSLVQIRTKKLYRPLKHFCWWHLYEWSFTRLYIRTQCCKHYFSDQNLILSKMHLKRLGAFDIMIT